MESAWSSRVNGGEEGVEEKRATRDKDESKSNYLALGI